MMQATEAVWTCINKKNENETLTAKHIIRNWLNAICENHLTFPIFEEIWTWQFQGKIAGQLKIAKAKYHMNTKYE